MPSNNVCRPDICSGHRLVPHQADNAHFLYLLHRPKCRGARVSRFWPASSYQVGMSPPSFDKQYVRDWLSSQPWDKKAPAPRLPEEVSARTTEKYNEALRLLTE